MNFVESLSKYEFLKLRGNWYLTKKDLKIQKRKQSESINYVPVSVYGVYQECFFNTSSFHILQYLFFVFFFLRLIPPSHTVISLTFRSIRADEKWELLQYLLV